MKPLTPSDEAPDVRVAPAPGAPRVKRAAPHGGKGQRKRAWAAAGGTVGVILLAGGVLTLVTFGIPKAKDYASDGGTPQAPPSGLAAETPDTRFGSPTASPSTSPTASKPGEQPQPSGSPSPGASSPAQPSKAPPKAKTERKPPGGGGGSGGGSGHLIVNDSGCHRIAAPATGRCTVTLTASGGSVHWSVASVNSGVARISAGGGGTLAGGSSTSVTVSVRPTVRCYALGFGSGSVGFAPGGSATISYTCW